METFGNTKLLQLYKIGYFDSGTIASLSVLPILGRAAKVTKRDDVPIISGFQSKERWENSLYTNSTDDLEELLANLKK